MIGRSNHRCMMIATDVDTMSSAMTSAIVVEIDSVSRCGTTVRSRP